MKLIHDGIVSEDSVIYIKSCELFKTILLV